MRFAPAKQSAAGPRSELQSLRNQITTLQEQLDASRRSNERQELQLNELRETLAAERRGLTVVREVARDYLKELATTRRQLAEAAVLAEVGLAAAEAAVVMQPSLLRSAVEDEDAEDTATEATTEMGLEATETLLGPQRGTNRNVLVNGALRVLHALESAEALRHHPPHRRKHYQHQLWHLRSPAATTSSLLTLPSPTTITAVGRGTSAVHDTSASAAELLRTVTAAVRSPQHESASVLSSVPSPPPSSSGTSLDFEHQGRSSHHRNERFGIICGLSNHHNKSDGGSISSRSTGWGL
ncbi:hypothetical protein Vretimale_10849 [Volvox reticuliferus]|uniref:Uncharacterized protein n=1 Tax=Volvox reticuliferus TaxID=1737510 RepID=A0A8J4GGC7_9CHLO|nr:hypothetical protein Vretimale_10849 [Volvox reticuliferus]